MSVLSARGERARRHRRALFEAAREAFATQGYDKTLIKAITQRVGITKGALYPHFPDKPALFAAIYQEQRVALARAIHVRLQAAAGASQPQTALTACRAFIDTAADPRMWRILFVDAPAVLDPEVLQEPDPTVLLLRQVFAPLMAEGVSEPLPLDLLIRQVWAMCFEAGLYIAHATDRAAARQEMVGVLETLLTGLWS